MINFKLIYEDTRSSIITDLSSHYQFNDHEHEHLKRYTDDSELLNKHLWNQFHGKASRFTDRHREHQEAIDAALNNHKTPHDLTVYSGVKHVDDQEETYHHPGYISTSLSPRVAMGFARKYMYDPGHFKSRGPDLKKDTHTLHLLRIHVPKGSSGAFIGHISHNPSEQEFLMPRGLNLNVSSGTRMKPDYRQPDYRKDSRNIEWHIHDAEISK